MRKVCHISNNAGYRRDTQRWLSGGKELDRMAGLDQYDFEARMYDPASIRFTRMDDMAEKYWPVSGYVYCMDNPMRYVDSTGNDIWELDQYGRLNSSEPIRNDGNDGIIVVDNNNNVKTAEVRVKKGSIISVKQFMAQNEKNVEEDFIYI